MPVKHYTEHERKQLLKSSTLSQIHARSRKGEIRGKFTDAVFPAHFLQFHPAVLKPDLDLPVGQVDAAADL